MTVVVAMRVLVLERVMDVAMKVALGNVQVDSDGECERTEESHDTDLPFAEKPRERCADEGSHCKDRARARRANASLREQVERKAQPVAGRAADGEPYSLRRQRRVFAERHSKRASDAR